MSKANKKLSRIKELEAENRRLHSEIDILKHELSVINGKKIFGDSQGKIKDSFEKNADNDRLFSKKRYTAYLIAIISRTSVFKLYERIISVVKKYTLVTVSLKVAAYILTILQSSAIFVLALSFFVVSLPFTFLFGYLAVILSLFGRRRRIKAVNEMIKNKKVTVFFASKGKQLSPDSFFAANLRDIKERRGGVAVIVSPYFFSPKGISDAKKAYALMRIEEKDIIIVRRHFFFTLNKRLFSDLKKDVTMIY